MSARIRWIGRTVASRSRPGDGRSRASASVAVTSLSRSSMSLRRASCPPRTASLWSPKDCSRPMRPLLRFGYESMPLIRLACFRRSRRILDLASGVRLTSTQSPVWSRTSELGHEPTRMNDRGLWPRTVEDTAAGRCRQSQPQRQPGFRGDCGQRGGSLSSWSRGSRSDGRCRSSSAGHKASSRRVVPGWSIASSRWMARARSWSSKTEEATAAGITTFTLSKPEWRHPEPGGDQPDYHQPTSEARRTPAGFTSRREVVSESPRIYGGSILDGQ
jgi:hypothetical protein